MNLDVNTPRGQETLAHERRCAAIFEAHYPGWQYVNTPKDGPGRADALLMNAGAVRAVAEQKSRTCSLQTFRTAFRNEWLVTYSKLVAVRDVAVGLGVPAFGMLYLVPDDVLLMIRMCDWRGAWLPTFRIDRTTTQATVNGGQATRENAYIDMTTARELRDPSVTPAPEPTPAPSAVLADCTDWLADYNRVEADAWGTA